MSASVLNTTISTLLKNIKNSSKIMLLFAFMFMLLASVSSILAEEMNVTLIYPTNGSVLSNNFTLNYSVNLDSNCIRYIWNESTDIVYNTSLTDFAELPKSVGVTNLPNGNYTWNVICFEINDSNNSAWATDGPNWEFEVNGSFVPPQDVEDNDTINTSCEGLDYGACQAADDCTWEDAFCMMDCFQFDHTNQSACEDSFDGETCVWDENMNLCDPADMAKSMEDCQKNCSKCDMWGCYHASSKIDCMWNDSLPAPDWKPEFMTFWQQGQCAADANDIGCNYSLNIASTYGSGCFCGNVVYTSGYCCDGWHQDTECPVECWSFDNTNETTCENNDGCVWYPEGDNGLCDPQMNFGGDTDCWQYDGDKAGCEYAKNNLSKPCEWHYDTWGPKVEGGEENGWCDGMMGSAMGCWDYGDQEGCNGAVDMGMPCTWQEGSSDGWCEEKGCWNYWQQSDCQNHASEGCKWDSNGMYCYEIGCWDLNSTDCQNSQALFDIDCTWNLNSQSGGWCEENGCFKRDWTNVTYCEAKQGCVWNGPWCNMKGCWDFDDNGQEVCENKTATGLNCQWKSGSWGFCEQKGCWSYDQTTPNECVNETANFGMSCYWDEYKSLCYEQMKSCGEFDNNEFGCYGTGWCVWNPADSTCSESEYAQMDFWNPGCWIFDQAGESKCENVTSCDWSGTNCVDNGNMGDKGVQCADINNSQFCNNIPMLSSCCQWNSTDCVDAPFTTACWDSMQEPPEGAYFCDDYNAKSKKATCNQIAGDPWYMPCYWDNVSLQCKSNMNDMFGGDASGFGFKDIGSKANCEAVGGIWKSEKWSDNSGKVFTDEWCEMSFGVGNEVCADSCWACEYMDNGTAWRNLSQARSACKQSPKGCTFFEDFNSYNGYGWCDMDWGKSGNCDQNCWDCWKQSSCEASLSGCKWFVDSWNENAGWCDGKNVKTCDNECYLCWDQNNCMDSDAGCSWNNDYWYCQPSGSGDGTSSEICFDGIDNDADNFVDCGDPECAFNNFCGGAAVFGSNCPSIPNEGTCGDTSGCVWIIDQWNNSWCDMEGAQCWVYDDNETACNLSAGCRYNTMEMMDKGSEIFCDVNKTMMDETQCWNYGINSTVCNAAPGCIWQEDKLCLEHPEDQWCQQNPNMGFCDHEIWSCKQYDNNMTACDLQESCAWQSDWWCSTPEGQNDQWCQSSPGWCDPICFSLNETACSANAQCGMMNASEMGWCEPENMFRGCGDYWNDASGCDLDEMCIWMEDPSMQEGGFCSDMFMNSMAGNMDKSPPHEIAWEECLMGENDRHDICFLGVKEDPDVYSFATGVADMSDTAICADKFANDFSGNNNTRYHWYLDTDGKTTGGCNSSDGAYTGFEFKFKYTAIVTDGSLVETKVSYKCLNSTWSPSMIKVTPLIDKMCYMVKGGVIAVSKDDIDKLKALKLFNKSKNMRIYATAGAESSPFDTIGPAWYTPNAADFKFENCEGFTDSDGDGLLPSEDPDCEKFLRFGYIDVEMGQQCDDDVDNDGNGLIDCSDPGCMYDSYYCGDVEIDDTTSPKVTWQKMETFMDGAFFDISTNEPTNATLLFYKNDSFCRNISNGYRILDGKLENGFGLDDYDVWHGIPCDQMYFDEREIDYDISNGTTYYYKTKLCDKSGNCALSACTPFTTKNAQQEYVVGFKLPPPKNDITEPLGNLYVSFDLNLDGVYGDSVISGDSGFKLNQTTGRDVNIKFSNPNSTDAWSIYFIGANLLKALSINISNAFIVNSSGDDALVGMNTARWKELAQKLGVDYIIMEIPMGIPSGFTGSLVHCPDDATDLSDSRCVNVSLDDVNCTFTTTMTTCKIPVSMGFSVYGVVSTEDEEEEDDDDTPAGGSSGGSSGGGSGGAVGNLKIWNDLAKGSTASMDVVMAGVYLETIQVRMKLATQSMKVVVAKLSTEPEDVKESIKGKVYQYLKVTASYINDSSVDDVTFGFSVERSWLEDYNVGRNQVVLLHYINDKWEELPTSSKSENLTHIVYEAMSNSFSYFAIGEKIEEVVTTEKPGVIEELTEETLEETTAAGEEEPNLISEQEAGFGEKISNFYNLQKEFIIFAAIGFAVIVISLILVLHFKNKH